MSYDVKALTVVIASPGDAAEERTLLKGLMTEWSGHNSEEYGAVLLPRLYEFDATPEAGAHPQTIINRQLLADADILIAVFWTRLGTATPVAASGSVEEIEYFIERRRPVLIYFSSRQIDPTRIDSRQQQRLRRFQKGIVKRALTETFSTLPELKEKVFRHLTATVRRRREVAQAKDAESATSVDPQPGGAGAASRAPRKRAPRAAVPALPPPPPAVEIKPPLERRTAVDFVFTAAGLTTLADAVLSGIPREEQRRWARIRWKTVYTIDLRTRLGGPWPGFVGDTLMRTLRSLSTALADRLLANDPDALRPFLEAHSFTSVLKTHTFEGVLEPLYFVDAMNPRDLAEQRRLRASEPGHRLGVMRGRELARILLCEILVRALIEFGRGPRARRVAQLQIAFNHNLTLVSGLVRELLVYNELRQIDSALTADPVDDAALAPGAILDFLWPNDRDYPPVLDYLVRWPNTMDVVVLTNDSARAQFGGFGPFVSDPKLREPYETFALKGRARGMNIVIAHHSDLDLARRQVTAWRPDNGRWERREGIYSEFFYDKFPSLVETKQLRDQMARDPRIQIWNKIVFTDLLADKYELSVLLENKNVPCAGPTRRLPLDAGREAREALLADLELSARERALDLDGNGRWIVVKPLTGWAGTGVERLSRQQFLETDFNRAPYTQFGALVVQPFFESEVPIDELGIKGRHDVRVVFVGYEPVFVMIRELPRGVDAVAASLHNVRELGGRRQYLDIDKLALREDALGLVNRVPLALGESFGTTPAIYSVDFCWVRRAGRVEPIVIELNSKPSQVWEIGDDEGRVFITRFLDAIVGELAAFHDEPITRRP